MKKSNILILAFSLFLMGITLWFFADAKYHEKIKSAEMIINYRQIVPFKVLVAESGQVEVRYGKKFQIGCYAKNKNVKVSDFRMKNDTLWISSKSDIVVDCNSVIQFRNYGSRVLSISDYPSDSLIITATGGRTIINSDNNTRYKTICVEAEKETKVHLEQIFIDKLNIDLKDGAKLTGPAQVKVAQICLSNASKLELYNSPQNFTVQRDSLSEVKIW